MYVIQKDNTGHCKHNHKFIKTGASNTTKLRRSFRIDVLNVDYVLVLGLTFICGYENMQYITIYDFYSIECIVTSSRNETNQIKSKRIVIKNYLKYNHTSNK